MYTTKDKEVNLYKFMIVAFVVFVMKNKHITKNGKPKGEKGVKRDGSFYLTKYLIIYTVNCS